VKYVKISLTLNHIPYSSLLVKRAIIYWKARPVPTLTILAAKITKPEY
jgi:hypothetical protein